MKILLTTLHAKYVHSSLALPYLAAVCMGMDGVTTVIREFTINEPADRVLRALVAEEADVVAFSCYIWNIGEVLKLASDLKQVRPATFIILGGPEASYGVLELMERHPSIDCIIRGEGEKSFRDLMALLTWNGMDRDALQEISKGIFYRDGDEIKITPEQELIPDLDTIPSPFAASLVDVKKPLVYFESTRGCPFSCAFCMSSLESGVRSFSMKRIKEDLGLLMAQRAHTVKLVDRTFNCNSRRANEIWELILAENRASRFHFEVAADLLTEENFQVLRKAPSGVFRFEIGIQSGDDGVLAQVGRKCDLARLFENVRRLHEETKIVVHLDLVAGLPGEDFRGFLSSLQKIFDTIGSGTKTRGLAGSTPYSLKVKDADFHRPLPVCHIQVEPLKVLKGSPMRGIAIAKAYAFSSAPPYKVLRTPWLSFPEICCIETVSRLLDLVYNSGKFRTVLTFLEGTTALSHFFAAAAKYWEDSESLSNLSQTELFDTLWRFAREYISEPDLAKFRDALCFDFCLVDYPAAAILPGFFAVDCNTGKRGKEKAISAGIKQQLGIDVGSRVRTFYRSFARDYRSFPWLEGPVEFLFVYISAPGQGLRIVVRRV
jgi:anaerobic magnesium-protoporphyrin IX monomethyl ester cyclase